MTIAFRHDELFETNPQISPYTLEVPDVGDVLIIDNFYRFPWEIQTMLEDSWSQLWKTSPTSRNGIDYTDCRLMFEGFDTGELNQFEPQQLIADMSKLHLGIELKDNPAPYAFNNYSNIKIPDESMQMYPHQDGNNMLAAVIYLDAIENGGTAFYKQAQMQDVGYTEVENVLVDVDKYYDMAGVVPAKFNRCVIYPSMYMHGGYIEDHKAYSKNEWRRTQVYFLPIKSM